MRAHRKAPAQEQRAPRRRHWAATAVRSARHAAARSAAALRQPAPRSGGSPPTSALRRRRVRRLQPQAGRRAARPGRPGESPPAGRERAGVVAPAAQWAPPATAGAPPASWRHRRAGRPASRKGRLQRRRRAAVEQFGRSTPGAPAARPDEPPAAPPIRPGPVRRLPPATRPASDRRAIRRTPAGSVFVGLPQSVEGKAQHQPRRSRQAQRQRFAGEGQQRRRRRTPRLARAPVGRRRHAAPASPARQCLRPLQP